MNDDETRALAVSARDKRRHPTNCEITLAFMVEELLDRIAALRAGHEYWVGTDAKAFVVNHAKVIIENDDRAANGKKQTG
jgi:hypothetical protein